MKAITIGQQVRWRPRENGPYLKGAVVASYPAGRGAWQQPYIKVDAEDPKGLRFVMLDNPSLEVIDGL